MFSIKSLSNFCADRIVKYTAQHVFNTRFRIRKFFSEIFSIQNCEHESTRKTPTQTILLQN